MQQCVAIISDPYREYFLVFISSTQKARDNWIPIFAQQQNISEEEVKNNYFLRNIYKVDKELKDNNGNSYKLNISKVENE